ncbi:DUF6177 family protein [Nocardiopsis sp. NPDC049922]|uniref:DUF6177 family protein n=1 Tax=Nocardiopsis sp. NPDC049922 TaxID=3155157 RepID=UPI003406DD36
MSHDVVALLSQPPDRRSLTRAMVEAGPGLRVRLVAEGALVELRDDDGRIVAALQAAQRLAMSAEADRLLADGVSDDLPAEPYWVEAHGAGVRDADTAGMVRRFARYLADEHDGVLWEPERRLDRSHPHLNGTTDHPAVTAVPGECFVVLQDRPVVPLSPWLLDAVARHGREGRRLQLVTPSTSRLTYALRSLVGKPGCRWVVQAPDGAYYDGFSGVPLVWDADSGFVVDPDASAEDGPHEAFRGSARDLGAQLLVEVNVEHPATDDLLLGGAAELLAETLGGALPSLWGTGEPLAQAWDRDAVTATCRGRVPAQTLIAFSGPPESVREEGVRPFAGTQRVGRTANGVRENITFAVGHEPGEEPDMAALTTVVKELAARDVLQNATVRRMGGRSDLTYPARWSGVPIPVGVALGAEAVSTVGTDRALSAPVRSIPFGPPMTPAVWYRIGDGTETNAWERFRSLMRHLHPGGSPGSSATS